MTPSLRIPLLLSLPVLAVAGCHAYARSVLDEGGGAGVGAETRLPVKRPQAPAGRSVVAATPADATDLLYVVDVSRSLEPAIDALERMLGAQEAQDFLDGAPLPNLAMHMLAGRPAEEHGLAPRAGLGLFRLPGFTGAVGLVAVTDGEQALEAIEEQLVKLGGGSRREPGSFTRIAMPDGRELALFLDRGYLYMGLPEEPDEALDEVQPDAPDAQAPARPDYFTALVERVRHARAGGLEGSEAFRVLRAQVADGEVHLYLGSGTLPGVEGALVSFHLGSERVTIDGFIHGQRTLLGSPAAGPSALLTRAPAGPTLAARLSLDPKSLAAALLPPGEDTLVRDLIELRGEGAGLSAEQLMAAFGGDASVLLYVDPKLLIADLMEGGPGRRFPGAMVAELSVAKPSVAKAFAAAWLRSSGRRFSTRDEAGGVTRFRTVSKGQPVEITVGPDKLRVTTGPVPRTRKSVDLVQQTRAWAPRGAFAPGHVTVLLDLAQVQSDLRRPLQLEGFEASELEPLQGDAARLMQELTRIDRVVVDVGPEAGGARISGLITFRSEELTAR